MKKYIFTELTFRYAGRILHEIQAVRDFGNVKKGETGGFIESEENLSHDGNAWVADGALVYDHAEISENALVAGDSIAAGHAVVCGNAQLLSKSAVYDSVVVCGDAVVENHSFITGDVKIFGQAKVNKQTLNGSEEIGHLTVRSVQKPHTASERA